MHSIGHFFNVFKLFSVWGNRSSVDREGIIIWRINFLYLFLFLIKSLRRRWTGERYYEYARYKTRGMVYRCAALFDSVWNANHTEESLRAAQCYYTFNVHILLHYLNSGPSSARASIPYYTLYIPKYTNKRRYHYGRIVGAPLVSTSV